MIGVIADDLTGAAELGGVGLRHGLRAEILLPGAQPGTSADLVCLDTHSRSCAPPEAARRAAAAAQVLRRSGVDRIYKKVDSVLRGQVIAELAAILSELKVQLALLIPANPGLGRVIRDGQYFVHGKLLHRTEFALDPEHPRRSANVLDLLGPSRELPVRVCSGNETLPTRGVVVGAVQDTAGLHHWAARWTPNVLPAGGAEFFGAWLAAAGHPARATAAERPPGPAKGKELFVCGSTSESSRQFVAAALGRGTPIFSLPEELGRGGKFTTAALAALTAKALAAFGSNGRVILQVGLPLIRAPQVAKGLSTHLTQLAGEVLRRTDVSAVYAEGGATALELARRMGWTRLRVVQDLAPGVAVLGVDRRSGLRLIIKPGTYVWPETLQTKAVGPS